MRGMEQFSATIKDLGRLFCGILDLIAAVSIPLTTLGGITELAPQPLSTVLQAPMNKFLWRSLNFFLQFFANRCFFFYFIYCIHLPKARTRTAIAALVHCDYATPSAELSDGRVDINL